MENTTLSKQIQHLTLPHAVLAFDTHPHVAVFSAHICGGALTIRFSSNQHVRI